MIRPPSPHLTSRALTCGGHRELYIHRIGRSGRWGRKGVAISFVTKEDLPILMDLQTYYACEITEMPMNVTDLL